MVAGVVGAMSLPLCTEGTQTRLVGEISPATTTNSRFTKTTSWQ